MIPQVYFDTNAFIAAFEATDAVADHAWRVLDAAEQGRIEGCTSELTLAESLSKLPEGEDFSTSAYHRIISDRPGLRVPAVSRSILIAAARTRTESQGLKLPDAIHLATALDRDCTHILTGNRRLTRHPDIKVVHLSQHSLAEIEGS